MPLAAFKFLLECPLEKGDFSLSCVIVGCAAGANLLSEGGADWETAAGSSSLACFGASLLIPNGLMVEGAFVRAGGWAEELIAAPKMLVDVPLLMSPKMLDAFVIAGNAG